MAENRSVRNKLPVKEETMWDREKFDKIYNIGFTKLPLDKQWGKMYLNLIHAEIRINGNKRLTRKIYWKKKKSRNVERDSGVKNINDRVPGGTKSRWPY